MATLKPKALNWITRPSRGLAGILALPEGKKVGLSGRNFMQELLKGLYSHEFLEGLDNDQIYDLFEEKILLPQQQHIKHEKPSRPTLNGNVYSIYPIPHEKPWWLDPALTDPEEEI